MNVLEKYAAKRLLIKKLASANPFQVSASHTSNPALSWQKRDRPTTGVRRALHKTEGATDNLLRHAYSKNAPSGARQRPQSSTNLNVKTGPISFGGSLRGGKISGYKVGLSGNLTKNLSGRASVNVPVGGGSPRYSAGLNWRF